MHGCRGLDGEASLLESSWLEGERAMCEHTAGVSVGMHGALDTQVSEHGVGFPAAQELDVVGVNACTEQGSCTAGAQRAGRDESRVDTSGLFECYC